MTIVDLPQALEASIRHYGDMLAALAQFEATATSAGPAQIAAFAQELHARRQQVEVFDRHIARLLPEAASAPEPAVRASLALRFDLMRQVQDNNRLLSEKIRGMMSVVSSELSQARDGRAAMSGYRSASTGRGALVSGNF